MVTHSPGKFYHCQLTSQGRARALKPGYDRRILVESLLAERRGPPGCGYAARRGKQVLRAPGYAYQRTRVAPSRKLRFRTPRRFERSLGRERHKRVVRRAELVQAREALLCQLDWRYAAVPDQRRQFPDRSEIKFISHCRHSCKA